MSQAAPGHFGHVVGETLLGSALFGSPSGLAGLLRAGLANLVFAFVQG